MPMKLSLISDVREVTRDMQTVSDGLADVIEALDDVEKSGKGAGRGVESGLDDATDAAKQAGRAVEDLGDDAKKAGNKTEDLGDDAKKAFKQAAEYAEDAAAKIKKKLPDATDRASEGMDELKDESLSTAKEAAASFGSVEDALDSVQEIAANALAGFGPAGVAAGITAAVGLGFAKSALEEQNEQIAANTEKALELGGVLADATLDPQTVVTAERMRDVLSQIVDDRSWYEFWQSAPVTMMEQLSAAAEDFGMDYAMLARAVTGDSEAIEASLAAVNDEIERQEANTTTYVDQLNGMVHTVGGADSALIDLKETLEETAATHEKAAEYAALLEEAEGSLADTVADAAAAQADYEAKVSSSLDSAGQAWEDYVTDGVLNLDAYAAAIEAQAAAVESFERNLVTASATLSAEALAYVQSLGPEAAPLLQAFVDAPLAQQTRLANNWHTLGTVTTDSYSSSLQLATATETAIARAQAAANINPIRVTAVFASDGLEQDIQQYVNGIHVPAKTVRLRLGQSYE